MENLFLELYGSDEIPKGKKVIKNLTKFFLSKLKLEEVIIRTYLRQRIFIRIKHLNKKLSTKKIEENLKKNIKLKKIMT